MIDHRPVAAPIAEPQADRHIAAKERVTAKPERMLSLDVLRGLTLAFMIVVNDQSGPAPFAQLSHAAWNGFTATDLVFPTFLFLIGISTVLSTASRLARGATRGQLFAHAAWRALLLVAFGFVVNNFPLFHLATARYYGVLPRIGICYFVIATLYLLSPGWKDKVVLAIVCLAGYWCLMRFVPVPGYGVPTHTIAINDHDGNLTAWLDRQIFSAPHLYERTRDPEGLLSTIPSIATALFGMLAGLWMRTAHSATRKATLIAVAGLCMVGLGLAWDPFFPINKKLWTSSYALLAGGLSMMLLCAAIYVVDIWRLGRARVESGYPLLYMPLLVFGTNAILAYIVSELGGTVLGLIDLPSGTSVNTALQRTIVHMAPAPQWSSLIGSLVFLAMCWMVVYPFYRKRIFLKI